MQVFSTPKAPRNGLTYICNYHRKLSQISETQTETNVQSEDNVSDIVQGTTRVAQEQVGRIKAYLSPLSQQKTKLIESIH